MRIHGNREVRSHCRQRVRTGVEEASANVRGECKAPVGRETGPRPGWTGDLEAHSRGLPQEVGCDYQSPSCRRRKWETKDDTEYRPVLINQHTHF